MLRYLAVAVAFVLVAAGAPAQTGTSAQLIAAEEIARLEGRVASGEATCPEYLALARLYRDRGDFELGLTTVRTCTTKPPVFPASYVNVMTFLWEKVVREPHLPEAEKRGYLDEGLREADVALAIDANHPAVINYKAMLLALKAGLERDPSTKAALQAEADALRARSAPGARIGGTPGPAVAGCTPQAVPGATGQPIRVGGNIRPPAKTKHVNPAFPEIARQARVQGVVILQVTVGTGGNVEDACVLRSIPLLDQAAIDAVLQWEFEPTLLNGQPVPVLMTVTVSFNLM